MAASWVGQMVVNLVGPKVDYLGVMKVDDSAALRAARMAANSVASLVGLMVVNLVLLTAARKAD